MSRRAPERTRACRHAALPPSRRPGPPRLRDLMQHGSHALHAYPRMYPYASDPLATPPRAPCAALRCRPLPSARRCRRLRRTPHVCAPCLRSEGVKPAYKRSSASPLHEHADAALHWSSPVELALPDLPATTGASQPLYKPPLELPRAALPSIPVTSRRNSTRSGRRCLAPPSPLAGVAPTFNSGTNRALGEHRPLPLPCPTLSVGELARFRPPVPSAAPGDPIARWKCFLRVVMQTRGIFVKNKNPPRTSTQKDS